MGSGNNLSSPSPSSPSLLSLLSCISSSCCKPNRDLKSCGWVLLLLLLPATTWNEGFCSPLLYHSSFAACCFPELHAVHAVATLFPSQPVPPLLYRVSSASTSSSSSSFACFPISITSAHVFFLSRVARGLN